jgi:predicted O-methyltransferase YrrM
MNNFGHDIMDQIPLIETNATDPQGNRIFAVQQATSLAGAGDWAEFGVWKGGTAREMLKHLPQDGSLYLFDSYEGLHRDWSRLPAGSFKLDSPPVFEDSRAVMVNGLFKDTAAQALAGKTLGFVHIDCDLYESTVDALQSLPSLDSGTIILFDEYVHNLGDKPVDDEHRAFTEWITKTGYGFRYLWRTPWTQVCVEIV